MYVCYMAYIVYFNVLKVKTYLTKFLFLTYQCHEFNALQLEPNFIKRSQQQTSIVIVVALPHSNSDCIYMMSFDKLNDLRQIHWRIMSFSCYAILTAQWKFKPETRITLTVPDNLYIN